ncbi:MAG: type II toxin-antitoxin system CcdA family antitoxin [Rhodospirillaceae bacterium]|nr:type II toxin-antitoxin system CcdA family antitoxin [Rhodospirillaceae bacterium]
MNFQRPTRKQRRKSVNVSLSAEIVEQAKKLGLNLSAVTEAALLQAVRAAGFEKWKQQNAPALKAHRDRVDAEGALLDDLRTF